MLEVFASLSFEPAYQTYQNVHNGKDFMFVPFFTLAFAIVIPSILNQLNRMTWERSRRLMLYITVSFFAYLIFMVVQFYDTTIYYDLFKEQFYQYVESSDCSELLGFISMYRQEQPRYIQNEDLQIFVEDSYFEKCGVKN